MTKRYFFGAIALAGALAGVLAGCSGGGGGGSSPSSSTGGGFGPGPGVGNGESISVTGQATGAGIFVSATPNFTASQVTALVYDNNNPNSAVNLSLNRSGTSTYTGTAPIQVVSTDTYTIQVSAKDPSGQTIQGTTTVSVGGGGVPGGSTGSGNNTPPGSPPAPPSLP